MIRKLTFAAPFLVAIFTVVTLYQANAERINPSSMVMPIVLGFIFAGVTLLLFWLLKWTSPAAPFLASCFTIVFLLWYTIPWYLGLLALAAALLVGIGTRSHTIIASILVIIITVVGSGYSGVQAARIAAAGPAEPVSSGPFLYKPGQANIYFIIPDRCPSPSGMREAGIIPDVVLDDLRERGFYINEDQVSADPYTLDYSEKIFTTRTMRYFASALNGGAAIPMTISYKDCRTMIRDNAVFTWLHGAGYSIVNIPSWFTETQYFTDQDQVYKFQDVTILEKFFNDELGEAYFSRTILNGLNFRVFESFGSQKNIETKRLAYQAAKVAKIAGGGPDSKFIMVHLTLPHEPYIFGDPRDPIPEQYRDNIQAALWYLDELAGKIRSADPTATIIIQSDEGMAYRKPADLNKGLSANQWSGVFSAWYLPTLTGSFDKFNSKEVLGIVVQALKK